MMRVDEGASEVALVGLWIEGARARAPLFFPTPAAEGTEGVQVLGARTMDGRGPIGSARGGAGRPGGSGPKLAVEKGAEESERAKKKKKKNATTAAGRCAARQGRGGAFCVQGALRRPPSFTQGHPQMPARRHPHPGRPGERRNGRASPPAALSPRNNARRAPPATGPPVPLSLPLFQKHAPLRPPRSAPHCLHPR